MLTPLLFEPITIGGLRVKNRLNMPPMHTNLGNEEEGINDSGIDFYVARAKGGFGLIGIGIIDAYFVEGAGSPLEFFLENDRHVANYARCVKQIRKHGAVPYAQVGVRRLFPVQMMHRETRPTLHDLPTAQIEEMIQAVVDCAVRAAKAGFPAVDILGIGGSAHSIFLSQVFNDRTDKWGGSPENRLRFSIETVRGIKKALGEDFPVFYRHHGSEFLKGGYGVERAAQNAKALEAAGVCYFNVSGGGHATSIPQLTPNVPHDAYSFLAAEIKKAVKVPVAASNRNNRPLEAEVILRKGWADLISLGRQSLADPEWPNKVARGDLDDLRLCIACNECLDITVIHNKPVHCLVNPRQGVASEVQDLPGAKQRKKVVMIGGGVTGLQAALTCAERGHRVVLFEKKSYLGGMWHHASIPPGREELFKFLEWLVHSVKHAGVDIRLSTEATEERIRAERPDAVIVTTGSKPVVPDIPGIDRPNVMPAIRALEGGTALGEKIAIIGGGGIGAEIAPYLARRWTLRPDVIEFLEDYAALDPDSPCLTMRGHKVTLLTRQKRPGGSIGGSTRWVVVKELEHAGVTTLCGVTPRRIVEEGVVISQRGEEQLVEADTVLIAAGLKPDLELFRSLKAKKIAPEVHSVGNPDLASHAIHTVKEAFKLALKI
jgi:2,4-dienoyl-CoA reductase (NADPH2)